MEKPIFTLNNIEDKLQLEAQYTSKTPNKCPECGDKLPIGEPTDFCFRCREENQ